MAKPILYSDGDKLERTLSVAIFLIVFTCAIVILFFNIDSIRMEISYSKLFSDETRLTIASDPFLAVLGFFSLFSVSVLSMVMILLLIWRCSTKVAHVVSEVFRDDRP
ncbi:hypothetical protein CIT26_17030 [Mesorhizobium temperatum]|uniref:Uncharacterized protein n=1 Tax=Mesorhizobium temperatum TaxID=241416 RepID=A0A271LKH9_9HYPH|nr:hypothetical protein CIT26_17030 [Mesorhizobium temperatum]